jgi:hypothetical protein
VLRLRSQVLTKNASPLTIFVQPVQVLALFRRGLSGLASWCQDCDWTAISRLNLWTVPVPSPVMRATLPTNVIPNSLTLKIMSAPSAGGRLINVEGQTGTQVPTVPSGAKHGTFLPRPDADYPWVPQQQIARAWYELARGLGISELSDLHTFEAGQFWGANWGTSPKLVGANQFIVVASRLQPAKHRPATHAQNSGRVVR